MGLYTLPLAQAVFGRKQPRGVEDERHLGRDVNKSRQQRIQESKCGKYNSEGDEPRVRFSWRAMTEPSRYGAAFDGAADVAQALQTQVLFRASSGTR